MTGYTRLSFLRDMSAISSTKIQISPHRDDARTADHPSQGLAIRWSSELVAASEARRIRSAQHAGRCYPIGKAQGCSKTSNKMSSAAGPLAAARRLIRRRVCGHSVIAARTVVPTSLARLTLIASSARGDPLALRLRLRHGAWQRLRRYCSCWLGGATGVQFPPTACPAHLPCHSRGMTAMREMPLEPAVAAGIDPVQRAREIQRERETLQQSGGLAVCARMRTHPVIRSVIGQDWATMLRHGVKPCEWTPQFVDPRELEVLQDDPDLTLAWQALVHQLGVVRNLEVMATVSDARGCVTWIGGNTKIRDDADGHGFRCGVKAAEMGTNGIRLVTQSPIRGAQIYGPEHWMDFQLRWTCTAVRVLDPHTRRLLAVINVTGPWTKVHSDTLGWLYQIALRIEDAVRSAPHRMQWQRLGEAAGPLERIGGPALVIDRDGVVVTSHQWTFQAGDRVLAKAAGIAPGKTFLPALGWCVLEPLPGHGWLVRPWHHDEDEPVIRVILDLTDPTQRWVRVTGPNVSWHSKIRRLHAEIFQRLANRPGGLTSDELCADLYGPAAKTSVFPEISKLRNEFGGLLHPPGDNRYKFSRNITVDIQQCANPIQ